MIAMRSSEQFVQPARPFTYADLETMPDDGYRREIIDGVLIVTPSPVPRHQTVAFQLARAAPAGRLPVVLDGRPAGPDRPGVGAARRRLRPGRRGER